PNVRATYPALIIERLTDGKWDPLRHYRSVGGSAARKFASARSPLRFPFQYRDTREVFFGSKRDGKAASHPFRVDGGPFPAHAGGDGAEPNLVARRLAQDRPFERADAAEQGPAEGAAAGVLDRPAQPQFG